MKILLPMSLAVSLIFSGCALWKKDSPPDPQTGTANTNSVTRAPKADAPKLIVTPGSGLTGKVEVYNFDGRFAVMNFPLGHMPATEQPMFVYRNGLKVGEIKITGPQKENNTVGDLIAGEAQKGDEVRDR